MKPKKSKTCPRSGHKLNSCHCLAKNYKKFFALLLALTIITIIPGYRYSQSELLPYYLQPFRTALDSLPDQKIKTDYYAKMMSGMKISLVTGKMNEPAKLFKEANELEINLHYFRTTQIENRWCVLVHEHSHLYGDRKDFAIGTQPTMEQEAELIWDDEYKATLAEATFAQSHHFLRRVHPDIVNAMTNLKIDLDTAVSAILLESLMKAPSSPYQQYKLYFPTLFLRKIAPQYRSNFRFRKEI